MADTTTNEFEIESTPKDGVSSLCFSPTSDHLIVSSWDMTLRYYDVASNTSKCTFQHKAPVLDCAFDSTGAIAFSGGIETWVRKFDLENETATVLGGHDDAVSSVVYSKDTNTLITGSWDRTVRTWDHRAATPQTASIAQPERVYAMDTVQNYLVVATAARHIHIYDTRQMSEALYKRESSLKFQTRTVGCMADGKGFATASVEGRIAVDYFDPSPESQTKKYAFKCHRQAVGTEDIVWPVNAITFHPLHNTFASGGSDGTVSIWDHTAKKRLRQYPKYHAAISSIAFSHDGRRMAVGVSDMWDNGEQSTESSRVSIFVREVGDEAKPKAKVAPA
ncbi:hypothetical protein BOTBODRAFT_58543 [Botryobasidium botryosum FD-172 SS1]|uniref:Uncharacterized protein n=1 Tax=Botryobasidium botryosum (strain FD-172 SS1) TaxID=930990 RepID=A0A067M4K1_BOTB1|nr:hypothetical protein BOTBODRAFT_58543 [Botryobasidium botryosum FD-172 SS1]